MISILLVSTLLQANPNPPADWAQLPSKPAAAASARPDAPTVPETAKGDYRRALDQIGRNDHAGATEILNKLGVAYPTWASVFAARCTAQVGLRYFQNAVEDCTYALKIDSSSASPIWWLAEAEAMLGKREDAARHFRQYAASTATDATQLYRERALQRAAALESPAARPTTPAPAEPPPVPPAVPAAAPSVMVVVPVWPNGARAGPSTIQTPVPDCRFSSDCGDAMEYSCRDWRGHRVCMGHGGPGAPCWFSSDCNSGSCAFPEKACR